MKPIIGWVAMFIDIMVITSIMVALLTMPSAPTDISPPYLMNWVFITAIIRLAAMFMANGANPIDKIYFIIYESG